MRWKKTSIGANVSTKKGYAFKSAKYVQKGVPIVRVSDYTLDSISDADMKYYPAEEKVNYLDFQLHEKDVIVQTVGSWQNNPASVVGKVVRVPYYLEGALLNQNSVKLIPSENINREFLFYRLKTDEFKGHILGEARGAANQASITLETIKSFSFLLPDYDEQCRIANILSAYDDLIENNQKQIALLEEAAQRLYKEWFVDLRFPGYEDTEIVDGVPEGWHKGFLKELVNVNYGKDHRKAPESGKIPVYGSGGLMRRCNKSLYSGESVLIPRKGSLNNIMYVNEEFWTVDTMFFTTMKQQHSALFIYFYLSKFDMYGMNIGAAVPSMTVKILDTMDILIPTEELLDKFDNSGQQYFRKINLLYKQIEQLTQARDRLLPKLMSGELEV